MWLSSGASWSSYCKDGEFLLIHRQLACCCLLTQRYTVRPCKGSSLIRELLFKVNLSGGKVHTTLRSQSRQGNFYLKVTLSMNWRSANWSTTAQINLTRKSTDSHSKAYNSNRVVPSCVQASKLSEQQGLWAKQDNHTAASSVSGSQLSHIEVIWLFWTTKWQFMLCSSVRQVMPSKTSVLELELQCLQVLLQLLQLVSGTWCAYTPCRYLENVPAIVPLLEKEFRNAAKRLEDTQSELNDLNPQKWAIHEFYSLQNILPLYSIKG